MKGPDMRFSSERQPERRHGVFEKCRKGHPMTEGDPNVRVRADGRRVCRACESSRSSDAYRRTKRIKAGVPGPPFDFDNLYYDMELYEHTSTDVLSQFYGWQKGILAKAKENPQATFGFPSGPMKASSIIETLEREMPILYQYLVSRAAS